MNDTTARDLEVQRVNHAIEIARAVTNGEQPDVFALVAFSTADTMLLAEAAK